jgi:hypothetical protein
MRHSKALKGLQRAVYKADIDANSARTGKSNIVLSKARI